MHTITPFIILLAFKSIFSGNITSIAIRKFIKRNSWFRPHSSSCKSIVNDVTGFDRFRLYTRYIR